MVPDKSSIPLVGWEFKNNNADTVRSSAYKQDGDDNDPKVNRYKKISNAGKVLGVIPGVGIVVGAARIITTLTDNKQLYGNSNLKKAGFIARGATEIIGLGIVWGVADAVSSLFRALSGKKTENKKLNEAQPSYNVNHPLYRNYPLFNDRENHPLYRNKDREVTMMSYIEFNLMGITTTAYKFKLDEVEYCVNQENFEVLVPKIVDYVVQGFKGNPVTRKQHKQMEQDLVNCFKKAEIKSKGEPGDKIMFEAFIGFKGHLERILK